MDSAQTSNGAPMAGGIARFGRLHPLLVIAAVAVTLFSLLGIAAITGFLPAALSGKSDGNAVESPGAVPAPRMAAAPCPNCGVVDAIRTVELRGDASGVGAVTGGVAGAVIGNQFGQGRGNTALTILGAAGGALAGNEIEKNMKKRHAYRVTVRMDDGTYRTLSQSQPPSVAIGDKVRIVNGALARAG